MSSQTVITSVRNPRLKEADRLRSARQRARQDRILIEGLRELRLAVAAGVALDELFISTDLAAKFDGPADESLSVLAAAAEHVLHVAPHCYEKLAFGDRAEGVLATAHMPSATLERLQPHDSGPVAILDGVEKPGNLGAILRTADAAGVAAVLITNAATDLYNPNAIRASLGTIFSTPLAETTVGAAVDWLAARDTTIYAARVDAAVEYTTVDWTAPAAILLGSEARGISIDWDRSDVVSVRLPMLGQADSLNVSATAAVLFYEALRSRTA